MANIKNMQMWQTICADDRISISKSLFGLRTTTIFEPTDSIIDANRLEYSPADGERIRRILEAPREKLAITIGNFHPTPISCGNYKADVCASRDGAFLALQLFQYVKLGYEPVTDVLIFEGNEAATISKLFY